MILLISKSVSYKKWSNNRRKDKNRQIKKMQTSLVEKSKRNSRVYAVDMRNFKCPLKLANFFLVLKWNFMLIYKNTNKTYDEHIK